MERDKIERIIQIIAIESAELLEQVQWASVEPKIEVILKHLDALENQLRDLRELIG